MPGRCADAGGGKQHRHGNHGSIRGGDCLDRPGRRRQRRVQREAQQRATAQVGAAVAVAIRPPSARDAGGHGAKLHGNHHGGQGADAGAAEVMQKDRGKGQHRELRAAHDADGERRAPDAGVAQRAGCGGAMRSHGARAVRVAQPAGGKQRGSAAHGRQHAEDRAKSGMGGQPGQQQRTQAAAQRHRCLADAHGQSPLAFVEPGHHGAAARAVDAATQHADQHQSCRQQPEAGHAAAGGNGPTAHPGEGRRRRAQACQQHGAVSAAVGQ
ncbi:hypothetical protein D3C87_1374910 [compost metagenome]